MAALNPPHESSSSKEAAARLKAQYGHMFNEHSTVRVMPGWIALVTQLHEDLALEFQSRQEKFVWHQIGEQFGRLTQYYHFELLTSAEADDDLRTAVRQLTNEAAEGSSRTCQVCGFDGGKVNLGGFVMTGCDFHLQVRT